MRCRLDSFSRCRRQHNKRAIVLKLGKGTTIKPEKFPQDHLCNSNFRLDVFCGNVRQSCGDIREHSLKGK